MKIKMRLERETKGALFFRELDAKGVPIQDMREGNIGTIYVRKNSPCGAAQPAEINVEVTW